MPVRCAVIGCGSFARYIHLPSIVSSSFCSSHSVRPQPAQREPDIYQLLAAYGFSGEHSLVLPEVDKGFAQELVELAKAIREHRPAPITEIDGARATLCAVRGVEAIDTGQAQTIDLAAVIGTN